LNLTKLISKAFQLPKGLFEKLLLEIRISPLPPHLTSLQSPREMTCFERFIRSGETRFAADSAPTVPLLGISPSKSLTCSSLAQKKKKCFEVL
jgi:hypothetical protein